MDEHHKYLLHLVMAQSTKIDLLYDLLVRHRMDLAQEAMEDLRAIAKRCEQPSQQMLDRAAKGWQEMIEAQQALLQLESRNAERP